MEIYFGRDRRGGRACAASTVAILGTLAVLALMGSPDGNSVDGSVKESAATLHDDGSAKLNHNVDDDTAWDKIQQTATDTLSDAVQEDKQAKAEAAEQQQQQAAEEVSTATAAAQKHSEHHEIRKQASQAVSDKIQDSVAHIEEGTATTTTQAAVEATHQVFAKANAEKAKRTALEQKALKEASEITSLLDRIKAAKATLEKIQKQRKKHREQSEQASADFGEKVQRQVELAKEKFKKMHNELESLRVANATLADETVQYASTHQHAQGLEDELHTLQTDVANNIEANTKELGEKDLERDKFTRKQKRITDKMSLLIDKMKKAIKVTAIRKATPHKDAQALLKELNTKSQEKAVLIAKTSAEVKSLKDQLDKAKDIEADLATKKVHRLALLKKAKETQANLQEAVDRYTKAIGRKDTTTAIVAPKPKGTQFAKKLYDKLDNAIASNLDSGVAAVQHKFQERMNSHADDIKSNASLIMEMELAAEA